MNARLLRFRAEEPEAPAHRCGCNRPHELAVTELVVRRRSGEVIRRLHQAPGGFVEVPS